MSNPTPNAITPSDSQSGKSSQSPAPRKQRKLGRKILVVLLPLIGLFVLIGALAKPEAAVNAIVPGAVPTSDVYVPPSAAAASAASAATLTFGQPYRWEDGMVVTLGKAQTFKPTKTAALSATGPAARYITFEVTMTNGTGQNYAASSTVFGATFAGADAERVFDSASKVLGPPMTDILPGKTVTFRVGFAIATKEAGELQVEVTPNYGMGYSKAIWDGTV